MAGNETLIGKSPVRVLVADDNEDHAELLGELLRMSGCEVVVTWSGERAVQTAKTFKPHLAILDYTCRA